MKATINAYQLRLQSQALHDFLSNDEGLELVGQYLEEEGAGDVFIEETEGELCSITLVVEPDDSRRFIETVAPELENKIKTIEDPEDLLED